MLGINVSKDGCGAYHQAAEGPQEEAGLGSNRQTSECLMAHVTQAPWRRDT